jgi:hypothetical protein
MCAHCLPIYKDHIGANPMQHIVKSEVGQKALVF